MATVIKQLGTAMGWTALAAAAFGQLLEQEFGDPPVDSRPRAFWCWLNGSMTREQITRDLREMKAKCMSGAEIWDVSAHRNPGGFVPAGGTLENISQVVDLTALMSARSNNLPVGRTRTKSR